MRFCFKKKWSLWINNVFVFLQEKVCMVCAWKVNFLSFILTRNSSLIPSISVTLWRVQLKSGQKIIPTWWGNKWGGWVELFAVFTDKKSFQRWHMALNPACHWRIQELRFSKIAYDLAKMFLIPQHLAHLIGQWWIVEAHINIYLGCTSADINKYLC